MRVTYSDIDRAKSLTRRNANPRTTDPTPGTRELRRAQEHRKHGRYYLVNRHGHVVATSVDLLPLARELNVLGRVVP